MADKAEENVKAEGEKSTENFIGTFKDKAAAEEGWKNLEAKLSSQGEELGSLRKQGATSQQVIEDLQGRAASANKPKTEQPVRDYGKELGEVKKEMSSLDPADETYQTDMMKLMSQSNSITAEAQHEKTLAASTAVFKKELDERDEKNTYNAFYKDHPDFNTPEMQMRIKDHIAADQTGMVDHLVAYREIQRDDAMAQATQLKEENAELVRRQELAEGTNQTGKVFTKSQSAQQQATNQPKRTRADRNAGMQAALDALQ